MYQFTGVSITNGTLVSPSLFDDDVGRSIGSSPIGCYDAAVSRHPRRKPAWFAEIALAPNRAARGPTWFAAALFCVVFGLFSWVGPAWGKTTNANQAIIIDMNTAETLFQKNADARMTPSSMTKILTAYVVFNEIKAGRVDLAQRFAVTRTAYARGGSSMFLREDDSATVRDLLFGLIIMSGNDAAITLAAGVSGSEENFAALMNRTAQAIGMQGSNFVNASGWPAENHYSTARDIANLSIRLINDHPDFYSIFAQQSFTYNEIRQQNRNPLLGERFDEFPEGFLIADGIKTGTTTVGGHGLAASVVDPSGRRLVMVLNGLESRAARAREAEDMIQWAFSETQNYELFRPGQIVGYAPVWLGEQDNVSLHVTSGVKMTLSPSAFANLHATLIFDAPLEAPVYIDQEVGYVQVAGPGFDPVLIPVVVGQSVDSVGRFQQVLSGLQYSILGVEE